MPLHFTPLSQYFAAEVSAVDLRAVHDRDTLEQIRAGMDRYGVLVFREKLDLSHGVGIVLCLAGLWLVNRR